MKSLSQNTRNYLNENNFRSTLISRKQVGKRETVSMGGGSKSGFRTIKLDQIRKLIDECMGMPGDAEILIKHPEDSILYKEWFTIQFMRVESIVKDEEF